MRSISLLCICLHTSKLCGESIEYTKTYPLTSTEYSGGNELYSSWPAVSTTKRSYWFPETLIVFLNAGKNTCFSPFWPFFLKLDSSYCFRWLDHNLPRIGLERIVLPTKIFLRSRWQVVIKTRLYHKEIHSITTHQQPGNPLLQFCALFLTFWSTLEWRRKTVTQRWS